MLDYCPGGDIGWHLSKEQRFSKHRARIYAAEVLLALEELHQRNIIFRDLKPENIVFDAMLTDFGLSREGVVSTTSSGLFCGPLAYLAPEVLKRRAHGKAVDWYLLGVLVYEMLVGHPPFYSQNRDQLFRSILISPVLLPSSLSPEAKSLIQKVTPTQLMDRSPAQRLGSRDSKKSSSISFFEGFAGRLCLRES
jgi:protein-serine/threonine kinase